MRDETVARNYAETLFELADRNDAVEEYGDAIQTIGRVIDENDDFRLFLETPRIEDDEKKQVVRKVFGEKLPKHVVNFILVTIDKRRQRILRDIAAQYHALLDERLGREHVQVSVARPVDDATREMIAEKLSAVLGKKAIPHVRVRPEIIGGLVVRTGDTIYDGSVRRRLDGMRRRLLAADLPAGSPGGASA
ncbi:MAG: ATP synthase F1 subunit delta [Longimicrobiales bacterium]|nr:ATP synthase F1 subunit delta [Longimicrobiales bacterium]